MSRARIDLLGVRQKEQFYRLSEATYFGGVMGNNGPIQESYRSSGREESDTACGYGVR